MAGQERSFQRIHYSTLHRAHHHLRLLPNHHVSCWRRAGLTVVDSSDVFDLYLGRKQGMKRGVAPRDCFLTYTTVSWFSPMEPILMSALVKLDSSCKLFGLNWAVSLMTL